MGFGEIASTTIMFIAVLSAATLLAFVFNNYAHSTTTSIGSRQAYLNNQIKTDISIENVVYNSTGGTIKMYVRNTGDSKMDVVYISAFIASTWLNNNTENSSIYVLPDTDTKNTGIWDPKEILLIETNLTISSGSTYEALVLTQYGIKDTYEFSV
jgi:archaellum component FlaG (FlaF/FlaG flagellin family)